MTAKFLLVLAICALATIAYAEEELYTDKFDYIDVDAILANDRLRNQYYACFLDIAPCLTPDAKFFSEKLPEALVIKCRKCTSRQKYMVERIVTYYTEKEPEKWQAIIKKSIEKYQKKKL